MKTCPYCADETRDVAVVCDNCGHDFATGERQQEPRQQEPTPSLESKSSRNRVVPPLALAVIVAALFLVVYAKRRSSGTVSQAGTPAARRPLGPHIILIAPGSQIDLEPGTVQRFDWTVPVDQPNCHLTGHIEVTAGGDKNVKVLVATADDYKNLANGQSATAYLRADTMIVNLDIRLNTPGHMVLAIGDTITDPSGKHVQLSDVKATCT